MDLLAVDLDQLAGAGEDLLRAQEQLVLGAVFPSPGAHLVGLRVTRMTSTSMASSTHCPTSVRIAPAQVSVLLLAG